MEEQKPQTSLPENAYRELKPGEEYRPLMPAASSPTPRPHTARSGRNRPPPLAPPATVPRLRIRCDVWRLALLVAPAYLPAKVSSK